MVVADGSFLGAGKLKASLQTTIKMGVSVGG